MRKVKTPIFGQRGFSLVELMVGMVIGLLTVLVITQVMALSEGKKRTTALGSDAQVNGALALFAIQRDVQQSGYGADLSLSSLGCPVNYSYGGSAASSFTLAPVVITDGTSGAPDTITVIQGNSVGFSTPMVTTNDHAQSDSHFTVMSSLGAVAGNMMISVPTNWNNTTQECTLFSITDTAGTGTALTATNLPHGTGTGNAAWNQSSTFPTAVVPAGSLLLNMGPMVKRTYSINAAGNLQTADFSSATGASTTQELYPQIVNLQALYGKDTVHTTGAVTVDTYDNVTPTDNAHWRQVISVRVAVVARSNQYEKDVVTSTAPLWNVGGAIPVAGSTTCYTNSKCIALDVSGLTDWQHYRYKVYDTTIPLRNVLWN